MADSERNWLVCPHINGYEDYTLCQSDGNFSYDTKLELFFCNKCGNWLH